MRSKIDEKLIKIDVKNVSKKNIVFDIDFFDFWLPTWVPDPQGKVKKSRFFANLDLLEPTWVKKVPQGAHRDLK